MDYTKILKRSWEVVWSYRVLWFFGILLAMTTTNGFFFPFNNRNDQNYTMRNYIRLTDDFHIYFPGEGVGIDMRVPGRPVIHLDPGLDELRDNTNWPLVNKVIGNIRAILISGAVLLTLLLVVSAIFRYTSETALIRMVDETENSGEKVSFRQGLRLGFSRSAWRIFLIDMVIFLPLILGFILLFALAIAPMMLWISGNVAAGVFGILLSTGLLMLYGMLVFGVATALSPLLPLFRRACAVDELGGGASIRQGFRLVSKNFVEVLVVWLIWIGTRLVWMLAMLPVFFLLLPLVLFFILVGTVVAGIPAATLGGILSLFMQGAAPWIIGIIAVVPIFLLVAFAPLFFASGLVEVFKSSTWTLAYRDLRALQRQAEKSLSTPPQQGIQAAQAVG